MAEGPMSTPRRPAPRSSAAPMIAIALSAMVVCRSCHAAPGAATPSGSGGAAAVALERLRRPGREAALVLRMVGRHAVEGPAREVHERLDLLGVQGRPAGAVVQLAGAQRILDVSRHALQRRPGDIELAVLGHGGVCIAADGGELE